MKFAVPFIYLFSFVFEIFVSLLQNNTSDPPPPSMWKMRVKFPAATGSRQQNARPSK